MAFSPLHLVRFSLALAVMISTVPAHAADEIPPEIQAADSVLSRAGLPGIPADATEVTCYSWSQTSAGVYAAFMLKPEEIGPYTEQFRGFSRAEPIPQSVLPAPLPDAPWFNPAGIAQGYVLWRTQVTVSAPELVRLFVDTEAHRLYLYYTWNNRNVAY
ncbi:MAG: hypothetical protein J0I10_07470 [Verrucomicrobia bacterium]|nr:hypothetical protein [Verrucomicrobiota bacterium]